MYGLDLISASTETHGEVYFHEDGSGSTTALTDDAGALLRSYRYHPFGAVIDGTAAPGAPRIDQLFGGQYRDRETGLYHLRARYYDPGLARFTQADPLPAVHGVPFVAAYAYANNAPLTMADPSGMRAAEIEYLRQAAEASYSFFDKLRAGDFAAMDLDDIQEGVGYLGIIPGIGDALDVVNGIVYLARGKYLEASLSLLAVVPIVGSAGTVGRSIARHADEAADAGRLLRRGGDEVMEGLSAGSRTFDGFSAGVARGGADFPNPGRLADPTADVGQAAPSAARRTADTTGAGVRALGPSGDSGSVFRGVARDHPGYEAATTGRAYPRSPEGATTPELHNAGEPESLADSPFTSWTRDREIAEEFAGPDGVVLAISTGQPPPGGGQFVWSPDEYLEQEVLVRGPVEGALRVR
jgi:RHS repeat-associated protein